MMANQQLVQLVNKEIANLTVLLYTKFITTIGLLLEHTSLRYMQNWKSCIMKQHMNLDELS